MFSSLHYFGCLLQQFSPSLSQFMYDWISESHPPNQENSYPPVPSYHPGPPISLPPPPDGAHTEGAQNGGLPAPHMIYAPPPGVMYAYPPHTQAQCMLYLISSADFSHVASGAPLLNPGSQALSSKRKLVKMAVSTTFFHAYYSNELFPAIDVLT